jgi:hypothetical protein
MEEQENQKPKRKVTENQLKNLRPIQPGEVRNPNGRPKNMFRKVMEEVDKSLRIRMTKQDVVDVVAMVNSMTVADIRMIAMDSQTPAFIAVIANAILGDIKNGEMKNSQFMIEFQHGKASQAIQIETNVKEDILNPKLLTDEQIRERLSQIRERDIDEGTFEEVV